ncbi:hypothetical protein TELCIR_19706 [Teladorsagia circumcincta]|uniref:7TM GPCR serpentine receptor class x (Srx) domain-containing protein n=1 Tax=Teladorsagia circumcincta TaxID=45464 RepID=A0A2G9TLM3_TELCI|nr:hypothetical protein TELCIR_19706 [Teladorsagia circumcincta]
MLKAEDKSVDNELWNDSSILSDKERESTIASGRLGKLFGQLLMFFWDVCVYTHLIISINRLVAISLPYRAKFILTKKCTCCLIALIWLIAFCHVIPYFWCECYRVIIFLTETRKGKRQEQIYADGVEIQM